MPTRRSAGPARLAVSPPQPSPAAGGVSSGRSSSAAHTPELNGQCTTAAAVGGNARPGTEGVAAGIHRASPASSLASAASVASSTASATSSSSRVVTASRRGRGMRPGDRAVAVRSPSPNGSGHVSALASPITSASSRHLTPKVSPSHLSKVSTATATATAAYERMPAFDSQAVVAGGSSSKSGNTGTGTGGTNANPNGVVGTKVKAEQEIVNCDSGEDKKHKLEGAQNSPAPPDGSNRYPIITIGGGSASPIVSQSPKAAAPKQVDPHDQRTPKHNHLSAAPRADRPPSPIQGPSSAAAAAAAAAKALRTGQGMMMRTPPGNNSGGKPQPHNSEDWDKRLGSNPSPDSKAPPYNHHQPLSHQPHPIAFGGYQPHAIPHSPDDNAAASAAYYAAMYGHNPYGGYYNRDMTTNWPEEAEGSERSASADSDDRGTKNAAEAAYRHFDERDRAYLQYHRQHQEQSHHYYQHHRGFFHHPGNGNGNGNEYRPPPHVAREYIPPDEHVGGDADGKKDVPSKRSDGNDSSQGKNSGKVVMGGASPIHVARGMSTSPLASNNTLAAGRHVTPHHHNHNTRHSSRKKMKEEEPTPSLSASSIFRGRPAPSMSSRAADDFDDDDEDSPQRILLSLSKGDSFEDRGFGSAESGGTVQMVGGDSTAGGAVNSDSIESNSTAGSANGDGSNKKSATKGRGGKTKNTGKAVAGPSSKSSATAKKSSKSPSKVGKKKATTKGDGKTPSSPDEPPRIQHSFSQNTKRGNDPFYFDPMRTPNGKVAMLDHQGPMIDNAPSFAPFFNTSFDSLGDPSKLAMSMSMSGGLGISPSFSFGLGVSSGQAVNADDGGRSGPYPMPNNSLRLSFGPSHSFGDHQPIPVGADASMAMVLGEDPNAGMRNIAGAAAIVLSGTSSGDGGAGSSVERLRSASTTSSPSRRSTISSVKDFYDALQSHKLAFVECAFLLPGLKEAVAKTNELEEDESNGTLPASSIPGQSQVRTGGDSPDRGAGGCTAEQPPARVISVGVTPARTQIARGNIATRGNVSEVAIARRRVKSAICAFGGSGYTIASATPQEDTKTPNGVDSNNASIFRTKKKEENPPVDSPGTTASIPPKSGDCDEGGPKSEIRKSYDAKLLARFYENNNRLTWEVEEDPPISLSMAQSGSKKRNHPNAQDMSDRIGKKPHVESNLPATPTTEKGKSSLSQASGGASSIGSPQGKMKYRCKLCGQPKQNHVCPYKKSLQRSIGTMVYSAVNAYTAAEPGHLAPSLSSMNNFVSKPESSSVASTPSRGGTKPQRTLHPESIKRKLAHITPQSIRIGTTSPGGSSLSTLESPPRGRTLPPRSAGNNSRRGGAKISGMRFPSIASSGSSLSGGGNFLFVDASEIRPGQFRAVAPLPKTEDAPYQYASLPLPYGQRKKLSDKLFGMSKEVPNLTDECAHVLREAREKDMWDRAIAELLTQILVVLDCSPEDRKLDGIRRHLLLQYGVAC